MMGLVFEDDTLEIDEGELWKRNRQLQNENERLYIRIRQLEGEKELLSQEKLATSKQNNELNELVNNLLTTTATKEAEQTRRERALEREYMIREDSLNTREKALNEWENALRIKEMELYEYNTKRNIPTIEIVNDYQEAGCHITSEMIKKYADRGMTKEGLKGRLKKAGVYVSRK